MRLVVRFIDYVGAATLAALHGYHALRGFAGGWITRAKALRAVASDDPPPHSEMVVRELLPKPKAKVLREMG